MSSLPSSRLALFGALVLSCAAACSTSVGSDLFATGGTGGAGGGTSVTATVTSTATGAPTTHASTTTAGTGGVGGAGTSTTSTSHAATTTAATTATSTSTTSTSTTSTGTGGATKAPVYCDDEACATGEICCFNPVSTGDYCGTTGHCQSGYVELTCSGPEGCPTGQICCATFDSTEETYKGISCKATCAANNQVVVCSTAHPNVCSNGDTCQDSTDLGDGYKLCAGN